MGNLRRTEEKHIRNTKDVVVKDTSDTYPRQEIELLDGDGVDLVHHVNGGAVMAVAFDNVDQVVHSRVAAECHIYSGAKERVGSTIKCKQHNSNAESEREKCNEHTESKPHRRWKRGIP